MEIDFITHCHVVILLSKHHHHITTRIDRDLDTGQNISRLIPALGNVYSYTLHIYVYVYAYMGCIYYSYIHIIDYITIRIDLDTGQNISRLIPALGNLYSYIRIICMYMYVVINTCVHDMYIVLLHTDYHITIRIDSDTGQNISRLIPALGNTLYLYA
jgi:hypothetical protein